MLPGAAQDDVEVLGGLFGLFLKALTKGCHYLAILLESMFEPSVMVGSTFCV